MKTKPISKILAVWCKKENARNGINRWYLFFGITTLTGIWFIFFQSEWYWHVLGSSILAYAFWVWHSIFKPEVCIDYYSLRNCHDSAPDWVLSQIADDNDVPEWVKCHMAGLLKTEGHVSFGALLDLEDRYVKDEQDTGFQKMMGYLGLPQDGQKQ
jgi:hypothetical protein